ncbi:FliM/FliN family flagellar motor C-terminal domain-containing protein [Thalassovita sp.]|uniref:FliM/FliN family flagellar motor C-terminal domain-containing protein n=1 Tax=Thalassovita sp. TaxID=1979401 RepID=UPI0028811F72|nr:FliM/FliN family flagellar motor C-terminal domain-containing protein [Thalassovita sp.]MDF1803154.1 FliM/FliN family flagellar motor C-terminal domain-containing protein [Thalassovita sp.]
MTLRNDILRRKALAAKEDREARVMSTRRALTRALGRAAELGLNLPLVIGEVEETKLDRDSLLAQVEEGGLMVSLDRDDGPPGLIVLDLQFLAALIEVQTLGRVFDKLASARTVTRTDAAVAMPLIDGTLTGFDRLLEETDGATSFAGYHFGAWVKDLRTLAAQLPDGEYTLFQLSVRIGAGDRAGQMLVALPYVPPIEEPVAEQPPAQALFREEVMDAPARLETILYRLDMSLDAVAALKPGDAVTVPLKSLGEIRLHTGDRQIVASGVLGQVDGSRAVRLTGFGQPRITAAPASLEQLPNMKNVDLADAGLVESPRQRQPVSPPAPPASAEQKVPIAPVPVVQTPPQLSPRDDPTGTEALLNELGLGDLEDASSGALALGPRSADDHGSGALMQDLSLTDGIEAEG